MRSTHLVLSAVEWVARRRRRAGEPVWLAVAVAAWLARRSARRPGTVLWRGRVPSGGTLQVSVREPSAAARRKV